MYHVMAIANYEDRFVIPSTHREYAENTFNVRGGCGFSLRQRLLRGHRRDQPVRQREEAHHSHQGGGLTMFGFSKPVPASGSLRVLAALLGYPDAQMRGYLPEMRDVLRGEARAVAVRAWRSSMR